MVARVAEEERVVGKGMSLEDSITSVLAGADLVHHLGPSPFGCVFSDLCRNLSIQGHRISYVIPYGPIWEEKGISHQPVTPLRPTSGAPSFFLVYELPSISWAPRVNEPMGGWMDG